MIKIARKITQFCVLVSAVSLLGCGGDVATKTDASKIDPQLPVSDWELIWSDEFEGTTIDANKWTHEVNCWGGGNNEKQCYTENAENSFVSDGTLKLVALPAAENAELPYTSARIISKNKADFKYGRFEIKAKMPYGQGSFPAFWMMPTDETYGGWPKSGEIDILETVNLKTVNDDGVVENNVHGTLHYGKEWPNNVHSGTSYSMPDAVNPADDFHVYAIEWQEGEIRWYVDDYLYATQRRSEVRYNSKDEPVGLAHQGWFAEYFDAVTGELTTHWDNAPFDQKFFMILNNAVGGDWAENTNDLGIDAEAFANGQTFEIDYIRAYQCIQNPDTGKGCETVRGGYDSLDDGLLEGKAPIPTPPSDGVAKNLSIFDGTLDDNWIAWDCCGGTVPAIVADEEKGDVVELTIANNDGTVLGFSTRGGHFPDDFSGESAPFDASPLVELNGTLSFEMKVVTVPPAASTWILKVEAGDGGPNTGDVNLNESIEGVEPIAGEWQTYTFPLALLQEKGLDLSAIDVVMVFPAWGTGEDAHYLIANMAIEGDVAGAPELVVFTDDENPSWPMWDCCGGSTPTVELDDDSHGNVAEFSIGANPTVMGFISREGNTDTPEPFDASAILSNGVIQFDMKVTAMPGDAPWIFKVEANNAESFAELSLTDSVEGVAPALEQWQTYTFNLSDLANSGLDVSAIDVLMMFPAWGAGDGAIYRVDNVKVYDPTAASVDNHVLFAEAPATGWSMWDCCGGSTPTLENDGTEHGMTAEYVIGAQPTVVGLLAEDDVFVDASNILANGVVKFDLKVITAPNDASAAWLFKIESDGATTFAEVALNTSVEGADPIVGEWQTYTFPLQTLFDAGLDISQIDVLMIFPAWGTGEGAVYRIDNVAITAQ